MSTEQENSEFNRSIVSSEVLNILAQQDIVVAANSYKTDTHERELAAEFIKSYLRFAEEIVKIDLNRGLMRSDVEIRDLISHVNVMMKGRDEDILNSMIYNCPTHYKAIHKHLIHNDKE